MPLFFFHLRGPSGALEKDDSGLVFEHLEAAYLAACKAIPAIGADILRSRQNPVDFAFEIADDAGRALMKVPFSELMKESAVEQAIGRGSDAKNRPNFRSAEALREGAVEIYRRAFEATPHPYLILTPDLTMAGVNDAYLAVTDRSRDALIGRYIFDAFPDNPADLQATGVRNLGASLRRVLRSGRAHVMPLQRYDIRGADGEWRVKHWLPQNSPVVDEGAVMALVHHVMPAQPDSVSASVPPAPG